MDQEYFNCPEKGFEGMSMLIKNCHIISPDVDIGRGAVEIDGDMIKKIYPEGAPLAES